MKRRLFLCSSLSCVATFLANASQAENSRPELTFGIVPQQAASVIARLWTPILNYIGQQAGCTLLLKTAPNIPVFEERVAAGEYDLAYMNPYHYTVFHHQPGYQALAKRKDAKIRGIIVVRKDSPIEDLAQLAGNTLAFPAPVAFAASLLPRAYLKRANINITPKYVSSHDSVYHVVAKGLYPAGGGIVRTLNGMVPSIREQLRILWTTAGYTPHAIAVHPRVPQDLIRRLQTVMVTMDQDEHGAQLLQTINFKGIESAQDADWDDIRGLGITELEALKKN